VLPVVANTLPLDAWVGLGWFVAAATSALGLGLGWPGRRSRLMFHHFGYHMLIIGPSFLALWLYGAAPASALSWLIGGRDVTYTLYLMMLIGAWGAFVVLQATGEATSGPSWARWVLSGWLKLAGRAACVLIAVSGLVSVRTGSQTVLMSVLVGVAAANAVDWVWALEWVLRKTSESANERGSSSQPQSGFVDARIAPPQQRGDPAALALRIKGF